MSILISSFCWFVSLRLHRQKVYNAKCVSETKNVDKTQLVGHTDNETLKEAKETCKHILLETEMENGRYRVFNFAMNILYAHTLSQKLVTLFGKLKCAAKLNIASGFVFIKVEDGICWYYYVHENSTLIERSKPAATKEGLVKIKNVSNSTDVTKACAKDRANTKWQF